jgi:hypothetical protein
MQTSMFEKGIPMLLRARVLAPLLFALLCFAACEGGFTDEGVSEGDRCNLYASHNECGSGLVCAGAPPPPPASPGSGYSGIAIPFCPENYCCSVDGNGNLNSSNPFCQPGCAGGAASICAATMDPGACAYAKGASLAAAMALDDAGVAPTPDAAPEAAPDAGGQ